MCYFENFKKLLPQQWKYSKNTCMLNVSIASILKIIGLTNAEYRISSKSNQGYDLQPVMDASDVSEAGDLFC